MVLENYLSFIKKQIEEQDKFNSEVISQKENTSLITQNLEEYHKPVTTELIKIEDKLDNKEKNEIITNDEKLLKFEPFKIIDKNIVRNLSKTIKPTFATRVIKNKTFDCIIINNKEHVVFKSLPENKIYIFLYETMPEKFEENKYLFTEGVENLIKGNIETSNREDLITYFRILNQVNASKNADYYNIIKREIAKYNIPYVEGEGVIFLPDNPVELFIELRKLLASKQAGHNNVSNHIHAILKSLLEKEAITETKYKNILSKYNI